MKRIFRWLFGSPTPPKPVKSNPEILELIDSIKADEKRIKELEAQIQRLQNS